MLRAGCCVAVGLEYECAWCHLVPQSGVTGALRLEYVLCCHAYMLSQHCAIGLQTDCMVVLPAPVVRLLDSRVYALWP